MFDWLNISFRSKPGFVVEPVKTTDLVSLSEIHNQGFSNGWSDGDLEKMLAGSGYGCLVARREGGGAKPPLGFVIVRSVLDEAEVITIAVSPNTRRKGIAELLMAEAIRQLQAERVKNLFLEVASANTAAIRLYAKLGFVQISNRQGYYSSQENDDPASSNALVMRRDLG